MTRCLALLFGVALYAQQPTFERIEVRHISSEASFVSGDFNSDGWTDLAAFKFGEGLSVYMGTPSGEFEAPRRTSVALFPVDAVVLDFNQDGHVDIAMSSDREAAIVVLLGDGQGGFRPPKETRFPKWVHIVAAADLDSDRFPDLAVCADAEILECDMYVLTGRKDGGFELQSKPFVHTYGLGFGWLADLDQDRALDFVYSVFSGIYVLKGTGSGAFEETPHRLTELVVLYDLAVADVDRDGRMDLIFGVDNAARIAIIFGTEAGRTAEISKIRTGPVGDVRSIRVLDLNGDDRADLLVGHSGGYFTVLPGNGDGTFQDPAQVTTAAGALLAITDLNRDGRPDLIFPNSYDKSVSVLRNTTAPRLANPPVVSATGYVEAGLAPGSLVSIYGSFLAPVGGPPLPPTSIPSLPSTSVVRINGVPVFQMFSSPGQINLQLPPNIEAGLGRVEVENRLAKLSADVTISRLAPALFSLNGKGTGAGLILHADGSVVNEASPAALGEAVRILGTGFGAFGENPIVTVGGSQATVRSYGIFPLESLVLQQVEVMTWTAQQIEFVVPRDFQPAASAPVVVRIGGISSNVVSLAVQRR